ncbi:SDR family NAD(P)-dependent oxidoreductase [Novosphingobium pentaromativorans]|uniref:Short-chain dehydrogenase/reductase SDR n=1 Tax=Novosphingobium pentaromativorans US6-1 TaxID=1088721 RepID=G6EKJ6_9SPHN|nr:SDR family NAD(P)-dependent oxidoreductase [Novosphingobium pentaromativorans]AIT82793.1 oxidoreductase [Novosphingobium pentaromativorans US6-1]EHJ58177.1 short-chain dehydrogenase/reductase SDR [Novosphingobium pentaromativorans US6-1]
MRRILVTGASGGLGRAIAAHYARPGAELLLWGRDKERLDAVAAACRAAGAQASIRSLDLSAEDAAVAALMAEDAAGAIDIAIFASGLGDIRAEGALVEDPALVIRLGKVNFVAPAAMAAALADAMARRGEGRIVLIGSAAAFHALPFAAAYAGTKAGLARFADALRLAVRPYGVGVTLVSPGFIDTASGRKVPGPKPMILTPEKAAAIVARAAERKQAHVVAPGIFALLRWFDRLLPAFLRDRLLSSLTPPGR